jgi:hypothetical protein
VFVDVYSGTEDFFKHLDGIPEVRERQPNTYVKADPPGSRIFDYEYTVKVGSESPEGLQRAIKKVINFKGAERNVVFLVRETFYPLKKS